MGDEQPFGEEVKRLRAALGLTQEALAEQLAYATQTISAIERGIRRPSREMAQRLADVLQVPPDRRSAFLALARCTIAGSQAATTAAGSQTAPAAHPPCFHPPLPSGGLVGRDEELRHLQQLLIEPGNRLVSLVGPGGIGKTRLALQTAHELADRFAHGALAVNLAPAGDAPAIAALVIEAMGRSLAGTQEPTDQLIGMLADCELLLLFDNFEHLLDESRASGAIELLDRIVTYTDGVRLLITSREWLRLPAERVVELEGLATPDLERSGEYSYDQLAAFDAVQLFVQRARQIEHQFAVTRDNHLHVARICALLQGMPLAIELAASWVSALSPREIAEEMGRSIDFLSRTEYDIPVRHRSMRAVFDHSWQRLPSEERRVLARLAVFRGGFEREAAHQVADAGLPLLSALLHKSLISTTTGAERPRQVGYRYDLHELLRQYLDEHLQSAGEAMSTRQRHAAYMTALVEQLAPQLLSNEAGQAMARLDIEQGNLRAALHWCLDKQGDRAMGLRLSAALGRFWYLAEQWREGVAWLEKALALSEEPAESVALALTRLGELQHALSLYTAAMERLDQAIARWRRLAQPAQLAWALFQAGSLASNMGRSIEARQLFEESLAHYRALGDQVKVAVVLNHAGSEAINLAQYEQAATMLHECLATFRAHNDEGNQVVALNLLGRALLGTGDHEQALLQLQEARELARRRTSQSGVAWASLNLGLAYLQQGSTAQAGPAFCEALQIYCTLEVPGGIIAAAEGLVGVRIADAAPAHLVRLLAAAGQLRGEIGRTISAQELALREANLARTRARLAADAWQTAWEQGLACSLDDLVGLARALGNEQR